ncbi:MAG: preprotein translocase subunit SecG [Candidatus Omnitrophota bacterium]
MYALLIIVHIFVCLVLIAVILLQAGRGGGLSEMIGGGQPNTLFGTQTNVFMTRATEVCAVVFVITSLSLGILSIQRGKSLIEKEMLTRSLKGSAPAIPALPAKTEPAVPAGTQLEKKIAEAASASSAGPGSAQ